MKIAYFGCVVGGLVVGVGLGWVCASQGRPELVSAYSTVPAPAGVSAARASEEAKPELPSGSVRSREAETLHRLEVLRWFKSCDERLNRLHIRVFDGETELSRGFVSTFGLSPDEASSLQGAVRHANERIGILLASAAKVRVEADNARAWVELPALPTEGGQIFDELLQTFKATLGPERVPYFEEFAADSFEAAFRNFGARKSTFELARKEVGDGQVWYSIKESYSLANSSGTSEGIVRPVDLTKSFPLLAKVLPASFTQAPARP